jgi:predicted GTPase
VSRFRCIIMGAAGRDFHDFLTFFRDRPEFVVCCFTAHQIPFIAERAFPRELAGDAYDTDIPIHPEEELEELVRRHAADFVFLAYSDLTHEEVMHCASRVEAAGASFALLGPRHTEIESRLPVVAVTAVRTGAGKSPLSQAIAEHLRARRVRVGVVRHPMPYGQLLRQRVQRFAAPADLEAAACSIEECEEYQPYLDRGMIVYAGVDYRAVLELAEGENEVILWDGGNNDRPFFRPTLSIVVVDALRAGHELRYHPGEINLRRADVVVVSKVDRASNEQLARLRDNVARYAPRAVVVDAALAIEVDHPEALVGRRVLVIEDGPTTTHGGMPSGAGLLAALGHGAGEIVDPRRYAMGTIAAAYRDHPHIGPILPGLGYSSEQRSELAATVLAAAPEVVVDASPGRVHRILDLDLPVVTVGYRFKQTAGPDVFSLVDAAIVRSQMP